MGVSLPPSLRPGHRLLRAGGGARLVIRPAWAQLARARSLLYVNSTPEPELAAQARQAAERAQALGPDRPDGPQALGTYYSFVIGDNRQALAAYEAGLRLAPNNVDLLGSVASAEQRLGRWDAALTHLTKAGALDPRSANPPRLIGTALLLLRRYPEAQAALDRAPHSPPPTFLSSRSRPWWPSPKVTSTGARAVIRTALTTFEPAALIASFGNYWDLYWPLDDAQQQQLLALPPSAFDNDRAAWALVRAETEHLRGHPAEARVYADTARLAFEEQLRAAPEDPSATPTGVWPWPTWAGRRRRSRKGSAAVALMPDQPGRLQGPTSSTSSCASTCSWASRRRRSTSSSRCSGCRITSRPAGFGSIPRSPRSGATRASRGSRTPRHPDADPQSPLSDSTGSTREARRAGNHAASKPTRTMPPATPTKVAGSSARRRTAGSGAWCTSAAPRRAPSSGRVRPKPSHDASKEGLSAGALTLRAETRFHRRALSP